MVTKSFNIEGMSCASCVQTVEKATKKLPGVKESNVNMATEKLNSSFEENALSVQEIQDAVGKAGYKALTDTEQKSFKIEGMTCASCVQTIEKATGKLDGVLDTHVNLATEKMNIE
ncbi:copper ion binding protein, partial [Planococcus sp. SIMBA_143]